ncbi:MAG: winged helix-turn-helix transcriptional regulator [Candidatus Nezhaarchaeota archaeon]|nr:winged helix-turn-helix transcriptional regulator [Candidatus Nezhaarchaeota archaeon]
MEESEVLGRLKEMKGAQVEVHLIDGRVLRGYLEEVDFDLLNVLLRDVVVENGRRVPLALVSGGYVATMYFTGPKLLGDLELKILSILQRNPSLSAADVAKMINERPSKVKSVIRKLKRNGLVSSDSHERKA